MKRDMDLIRKILITIEEAPPGFVKFNGEDARHVELMVDAGLLFASIVPAGRGDIYANVERLSWAGHDFLNSMRDETIWRKAKEKVLIPGASWTFDILKEWAKYELQKQLGLPVQ